MQVLAGKILGGVIALLVVAAIAFAAGVRVERNAHTAALATQQAAALDLRVEQLVEGAKVEVRYVDRIEKVSVPVVQIRDRIVRAACPGGVHDSAADRVPVPSGDPAEPADAAAPADADDGLLGDLAAEIPACVANGIQLDELQARIRTVTADP